MKKIHCTPSSRVPAARMFSTTGYIITTRRNCLQAKILRILTFINLKFKFVSFANIENFLFIYFFNGDEYYIAIDL